MLYDISYILFCQNGSLAEPDWEGGESRHLLEHFCLGDGILSWLGAFRDDALSSVYWQYRKSRKIFHVDAVVPMVEAKEGLSRGELITSEEEEDDERRRRKKREAIGRLSREARRTGLDHDNILVCGRLDGWNQRGFGQVKSVEAMGRGLCEKWAVDVMPKKQFNMLQVGMRNRMVDYSIPNMGMLLGFR